MEIQTSQRSRGPRGPSRGPRGSHSSRGSSSTRGSRSTGNSHGHPHHNNMNHDNNNNNNNNNPPALESRRGPRGNLRGSARGRSHLFVNEDMIEDFPRSSTRILAKPHAQMEGKYQKGTSPKTYPQGGESLWIIIEGFNQSERIDVENVKSYLSQKSQPEKITIKEAKVDTHGGKKLKLQVGSQRDVRTLTKLSGIRYGANHDKLTITREGQERRGPVIKAINFNDPHVIEVKNHLEPQLAQRYNPQTQALDMSGNIAITENTIAALISLCQNIPITTINFANCGLSSLRPFGMLLDYLPNLENLSFAFNNINDADELDIFRENKTKLKRIRFEGNPLSKLNNYHEQVTKKLPGLIQIDDSEPRRVLNFGMPMNTTSSVASFQIQSVFTESSGVNDVILPFLQRYYQLFEQNEREKLLDVYTDISVYSMTSMQKSKSNFFYPRWSHNLNFLHSEDEKRISLVQQGRSDIVHFLKSLPQVSFGLNKDPLYYEAFFVPQANYICISIHGQFTEIEHNNKFHYDQTFLLSKVVQGSASYQSGWSAIVINQQMCIRDYTGPMPTPTKTAPALQPEQSGNLNQNQNPQSQGEQMILALIKVTNLKHEFAEKCLKDNNWDYLKALEAFKLSQNQISRDMFMN